MTDFTRFARKFGFDKNIRKKKKTKKSDKINENELRKTFDDIILLILKKNRDYGNSFSLTFEEFGLLSLIIRLSDKIERLKNLNNNELEIKDESVEDSLKDIIGYSILGLIELHKIKRNENYRKRING